MPQHSGSCKSLHIQHTLASSWLRLRSLTISFATLYAVSAAKSKSNSMVLGAPAGEDRYEHVAWHQEDRYVVQLKQEMQPSWSTRHLKGNAYLRPLCALFSDEDSTYPHPPGPCP